MTMQVELPPVYTETPVDDVLDKITAAKARLGSRLVILGHHYQCDEIVHFADYIGDSFKLSQYGASRRDAEFIVFCGVHFMAESADILAADHQRVILPDLTAGCSMADMADIDQVETCWEVLSGVHGPEAYLPITYMNSSAAIKAFCGRHGGIVCTSSNAEKVYDWALGQGKRLIFMPDQHLGRNVGYRKGIPLDAMKIWSPLALPEDNLARGVADATVVLWQGHCSVHGRFLPEHVEQVRNRIPGVKVISHPECMLEVVLASDASGSTEKIIKTVSESPAGSAWAVGTEIHLVHRLAKQHPDKTIVSLAGMSCLCSTMYRIDPPHLLWALENLEAGRVVNEIVVDEVTKRDAKIALERMLALA